MNKIPVPQTSTFKCLGVDLDQKLNWEKHIDSVCHKISAGIGAMKRINLMSHTKLYKMFTKH